MSLLKKAIDVQTAQDEIFKQLTYEEFQKAINVIIGDPKLSTEEKLALTDQLHLINYEIKPPTMEEFLTPKYLGPMADKIYPHVRKTLVDYMNPTSGKRVLALSTTIGFGKSSLSAILILYIIVHLAYMRNPKKFFNLGEMGSLVAVLISFTQKKANQLLLKPFMNLLKGSPIFHQVRQEDRLEAKQAELPKGHIAYTTAGRMGSLQFIKDIHVVIVSDRADLLGLNIFAGVASEISFWINRGVSPDEIWGMFTDLRGRIQSRFGSAYLTTTILDSSPLDIDASPIDKWLYTGEALKDPEVMFINAKHWDIYKDLKPQMYKKWISTGETFPVFRGNSSLPPKILTSQDLEDYNKEEVYDVPIDLYNLAKDNVKKFVADYCAYPAGGLSRLFENFKKIDEVFTLHLKNQYTAIAIPEEKDPKELIWNQIRDKFFIKVNNRYQFYNAPTELRAIHIDLSETGDISSITMSHKEYNLQGQEIVVHDFNIPLHKGKSRINIDAVCEFVLDLKKKGGINLFKVTADQYQSAAILQRLRRDSIPAEKLSVDRETGPYMLYASWIKNGKVKAGKSIHLRNNLKSLVEVQREKGGIKIDHLQGQVIYEDNLSWDMSQVGYMAKDVSDTACGSFYSLVSELKVKPKYTFDDSYDPENPEETREKLLKFISNDYLKIKTT